MAVSNDREAVNGVRDVLRDNLLDPRQQYTNETRTWVHNDNPLTSATFPRIQIRRRVPTVSEIIDIGRQFLEQRILVLDIQMWSKAPFKWQNTDNTYLQDEELIKEWYEKIWQAIKDNQATLYDTYGITGVKLMSQDEPYPEDGTQFHTGTVSVRIWYFKT